MSALNVTWGITQRSLMLIPRFPSTFVPSLVMPVFLLVAFAGAFSGLVAVPGFPAEKMIDWILPMSTLQGCAFAGVTTGMAVARDLENGFFDRFVMSPAPRGALLAGPLVASVLRALFPLVLLPLVGFLAGAHFKGGFMTLVPLAVAGLGMALIAGQWAVGLALRTRSQQAAPLMQMALFLGFFLSTAQMPLHLLTGWVYAVARFNPITNVLELARQGFLGDVRWESTWPGLVSLAGMAVVLGLFAHRGLRKIVP
ncbi:MAG: ABC transporter permease [Actinomycetota bacterium]|nr:ABC transporter permease [Actinomycetota bacterium]